MPLQSNTPGLYESDMRAGTQSRDTGYQECRSIKHQCVCECNAVSLVAQGNLSSSIKLSRAGLSEVKKNLHSMSSSRPCMSLYIIHDTPQMALNIKRDRKNNRSFSSISMVGIRRTKKLEGCMLLLIV